MKKKQTNQTENQASMTDAAGQRDGTKSGQANLERAHIWYKSSPTSTRGEHIDNST
jgi:hypothetical protein